MNGASFVHLHVHSEYSLLDGVSRIPALAKRAAELGMEALALTDHGVLYGAIPFYRACRAEGIRPIIGCELYMTTGARTDKGSRKENPNYHLIVLAKNETGYRNLMKLSSLAYLEGFHYKPRVDMAALSEHSEGLVCLSSCLMGEVSQHLLHERLQEAREAALRYQAIFGDDFYLELQDHGMLEQKLVNQRMIDLARELGIKLVATNDAHYLKAEDAAVQDVLICIGTGKTLEDEGRLKMSSDQMFLKSAEQMEQLFRHVPEAIANTLEVADKCRLTLDLGRVQLPVFQPVPSGYSSGAYLAELCREGLLARYVRDERWHTDAAFKVEATERLAYELSVIERMGYSDYFLIVWDFIRFAHEQGIRTGPGRGSSAGSLVAYVLRITDVDPLRYRLLFERFLNPDRISMPDIDIDFDDLRRDEVIAYVAAKYGEEHVAQIITFGTMAAKAAVRDVGRAMNLPYAEVDRTAKLIPRQLGITLSAAVEQSKELAELSARSPKVAELLRMAQQVEGMPRHASTHAAGVVISRTPLTDFVPLQTGSEEVPLTQYSMEYLEAVGLLKMDFLGLRTLSLLERTLSWIKRTTGEEIDFAAIDNADPLTYEMLGKGETTGVFQLESAGMRRVLRDLKPTVFEDIISVLALYRPGPMEFIPKYIGGKHGRIQVSYPHPDLESILADTYGIIVYQEQIMQIASKMAGFSLGEADLLRRAVSKKKREVLDEERGHFVTGSLKQGYSAQEANRVYDMIVRFADYGFPRAHAAAYGVLAFQTAWLKAHYPAVFMSAMLATVSGNQRKMAEYIEECRRMGIEVLPPDVNESDLSFTPVGAAIRFGLSGVKNVGTAAIEAFITERAVKPFESLLDICQRADLKQVNKRVLESLIHAGALDSLPGHRAQLLAVLDETVDTAIKWRKERADLQIELFGLEEVQNWDVELPDISPLPSAVILESEREMLGLYLSGHPLDDLLPRLEQEGLPSLLELADLPERAQVTVAGMVVSVKPFVSKKGASMGFIEIEDRVLRVEGVVFSKSWERTQHVLRKGVIVAVSGSVQHQDEDFKLLIDDAIELDSGAPDMDALHRLMNKGRGRYAQQQPRNTANSERASSSNRTRTIAGETVASSTRGTSGQMPLGAASETRQRVFIKVPAEQEAPQVLERLKVLLLLHKGDLPTVLFYEKDQRLIALSDRYSVKPSDALLRSVEQLLGKGSLAVR